MNERIEILDYDPDWGSGFQNERKLLHAALPIGTVDVHHIGSTAVPGLAAKPIIDIMMAVPQLDLAQDLIAPLAGLGYAHQVDSGAPDRMYFRKGTPRTHHLHVVEQGSRAFREHLVFRDYLRTHPEAAKAYAELKRKLADELGHDRAAYTEAKAEFITACVHDDLTPISWPKRIAASYPIGTEPKTWPI